MPKPTSKTTITTKSFQINILQTVTHDRLANLVAHDRPLEPVPSPSRARPGLGPRARATSHPVTWGRTCRRLVDPSRQLLPVPLQTVVHRAGLAGRPSRRGRAVQRGGALGLAKVGRPALPPKVSAEVPAGHQSIRRHRHCHAMAITAQPLPVRQGETIWERPAPMGLAVAVVQGHPMCPDFLLEAGHFAKRPAMAFCGRALPYPTLPCPSGLQTAPNGAVLGKSGAFDRFKRPTGRFLPSMHPTPRHDCLIAL